MKPNTLEKIKIAIWVQSIHTKNPPYKYIYCYDIPTETQLEGDIKVVNFFSAQKENQNLTKKKITTTEFMNPIHNNQEKTFWLSDHERFSIMLFATNDMDYRSKWTSLNDNHNPINLLHSKYILKNTDLSRKNIVAVHSSIRSEEISTQKGLN